MPASRKKKYLGLGAGLLFLALLYLAYNYFGIARDYIYGIPILFRQNRYLDLDIYPHGFDSATVFTCCNVEATTPPGDIDFFRLFLKKHGIRGVFFVIPDFIDTYPLKNSPAVIEELEKLREDGHEIAQNGTYHTFGPDLARGSSEGGELEKLDYDEQKDRLLEGRNQLAELGFLPMGFRAPEFITNPDTFRVLETCDYLYSSSTLTPPRTFGALFRRPLTEGILYPYHPSGYSLLEFTDQLNPIQKYEKAIRIFRRIHSLNGVFVYHTYIGTVSRPENLQILEKFLAVILAEKTWCCTLDELSRWWLAREKLRVETKRTGDTLEITVANHTPFPLVDLGARFLKYPYGTKRYVIRDGDDRVLAQGQVPATGKIFFSIPGHRQ